MTFEFPRPGGATAGRAGQDVGALATALGEAIRTVPGVVDLAPTLVGEAARLGGALLHRRSPVGGQGLEIQLTEAGVLVQVDVAASAHRPLLDTARDVQASVLTALAGHGLTGVSVTVSVLTLHT